MKTGTAEEGKTKDKVLTGAAGAHYIAFRLTVEGYAVGLTTHGTRAIDLVVANPNTGKSITIQTKTMRNAFRRIGTQSWHYWRAGTSARRPVHKTFFYAFVDLCGGTTEMPDVYIVPSPRLNSLLSEFAGGDCWCNIGEEDTPKYKERWDVIRDALA